MARALTRHAAAQSWFKLIWDLADADVDGSLTAPEFAVASYFLDRAAEGRCVAASRSCAASIAR